MHIDVNFPLLLACGESDSFSRGRAAMLDKGEGENEYGGESFGCLRLRVLWKRVRGRTVSLTSFISAICPPSLPRVFACVSAARDCATETAVVNAASCATVTARRSPTTDHWPVTTIPSRVRIHFPILASHCPPPRWPKLYPVERQTLLT